jgi:hypothetical protein
MRLNQRESPRKSVTKEAAILILTDCYGGCDGG